MLINSLDDKLKPSKSHCDATEHINLFSSEPSGASHKAIQAVHVSVGQLMKILEEFDMNPGISQAGGELSPPFLLSAVFAQVVHQVSQTNAQ